MSSIDISLVIGSFVYTIHCIQVLFSETCASLKSLKNISLFQSPSAAASESADANQSSAAQGWRSRCNFDTIRPSIYVKKEQRKHELENRLREQAAGGYNQMRRLHQKSLRQVGYTEVDYRPARASPK